MTLESSIDKLLPRKLTLKKARQIDAALGWQDHDLLEPLSWEGYVELLPDSGALGRYIIAPAYESAYRDALKKMERTRLNRNARGRMRSSTLSSLGLRRTRSGSWE
jgi:hypothetical protein